MFEETEVCSIPLEMKESRTRGRLIIAQSRTRKGQRRLVATQLGTTEDQRQHSLEPKKVKGCII